MSYGTGLAPSPTEVLRSLADPTRRAIFEHLMQGGEQNVRALTDQAGVSQAAVSKHLVQRSINTDGFVVSSEGSPGGLSRKLPVEGDASA